MSFFRKEKQPPNGWNLVSQNGRYYYSPDGRRYYDTQDGNTYALENPMYSEPTTDTSDLLQMFEQVRAEAQSTPYVREAQPLPVSLETLKDTINLIINSPDAATNHRTMQALLGEIVAQSPLNARRPAFTYSILTPTPDDWSGYQYKHGGRSSVSLLYRDAENTLLSAFGAADIAGAAAHFVLIEDIDYIVSRENSSTCGYLHMLATQGPYQHKAWLIGSTTKYTSIPRDWQAVLRPAI